MNLRHKFGILALIYILALSANLVMSAWCILVFFQSAFVEFQVTESRRAEIEWIRTLVREQLKTVENDENTDNLVNLRIGIGDGLSRLEANPTDKLGSDLLESIRIAAQDAHEILDRWITSSALGDQPVGPPSEAELEPFQRLDLLLSTAATVLSKDQETAIQRVGKTQQRVVLILVVNAGIGMLLCVLGVYLIQRWVLRPVEDLRTATKEISHGHFEHRMVPRSRDELGQFAEEVNTMAGTIVQMQAKLVEQERLAAAGEMVTRLAHNIRNPLAGIRGLAEETLQLGEDNETIADTQKRIISSIDRFEKWLRDLQKSVSPLTLNPQSVSLEILLEHVLTALRPMIDRRGVTIETMVPSSMPNVELDEVHFEQVLVALVTNAVQASKSGQTVRISAESHPGLSGRWLVAVEDEGEGVALDIQEKIFLPYFTTKSGGNGVGLTMSNKVVKIHGGRLTVESKPGAGAKFIVDMPGLLGDT